MNSTDETLLFDRFLIMYNLCVFTCIIFIFVFHCNLYTCANVICIKLLPVLTYLLTLEAPPEGQRENCHRAKMYTLRQRRLKKVISFYGKM